MIAKLVVWAPTRELALARMRRATDEFVIEGVPTTLPLLRALCDARPVLDASYGTATLEPLTAELYLDGTPAVPAKHGLTISDTPPASQTSAEVLRVEVNDRLYRVRLIDLPKDAAASNDAASRKLAPRALNAKRQTTKHGNSVVSPMHGVVIDLKVKPGDTIIDRQVVAVVEAMKMMNEIRAHKAGSVAAVHACVGDTIEAGSPLITIE